MKPGVEVKFNGDIRPPPPIEIDFTKLPPPSDAPYEEQKRAFIEGHGGPEAEADFNRWWEAHQ